MEQMNGAAANTVPLTSNGRAQQQGGGALSPRKLVEMSEGFASYTAATTDVDQDGAGQTAAEFAKLLLQPNPKVRHYKRYSSTKRHVSAMRRHGRHYVRR